MWPCGIVTLISELFLAESKAQVYGHLHQFLQSVPTTASNLSKLAFVNQKEQITLPDTCAYDSNDVIIKPSILLYVPMHSACDYSLPIQSSFAMMMPVIFEDMQEIPLAVA